LSCLAYPNPTNNQVLLRINANKTLSLWISIRNTMGQLLYNENVNPPQEEFLHSINMKNWSAGMYFIRINNGQETITEK